MWARVVGRCAKIVVGRWAFAQQVMAATGTRFTAGSMRTALDRHDPSNAPLRVLPGTHVMSREEVEEELRHIEIATGQHDEMPELLFASHPREVEVILDPRWTLVWTPSCWHATGVKTAAGPRRAMAWNYFPSGGRKRDVEALKYVIECLGGWSDDRKGLWGLWREYRRWTQIDAYESDERLFGRRRTGLVPLLFLGYDYQRADGIYSNHQ